ncbi:MAG: carbohydrate kinase family protein [Candidatus Hydrogenedens sp.]|nr:carbohydrate kinase family protein [Candidatus Hydrogenedens sp.]
MREARAIMAEARRGMAGIGTFIMDHVRMIDVWPQQETLANVATEHFSPGGLAHNLVVDVAKYEVGIPLEAVGFVGNDDDGRSIIELCTSLGVDCTHLKMTDDAPTSYTEVMTVQSNGKRTFFHSRGANNLMNADNVPYSGIKSRIAHVGYLLLMDGIDQEEPEFGTVAAKILHHLQAEGIKTSFDTVSEFSERFKRLVPPALKYTDYAILNEFEAGQTTGHAILKDDKLDAQALRDSARTLLDMGESEVVVVHMSLGAYALTRAGKEYFHPSFQLPEGYIQGGAGAGDAFCAGVLVGIHEGWDMEEGLRFGTAAATLCMADATCTEGVGTHAEAMKLFDKFPLRPSAL